MKKPPMPPLPMGDPARWPLGSPQSRAAARAMADSREHRGMLLLYHNIRRPERAGEPPREMTPDGLYVLRVPVVG